MDAFSIYALIIGFIGVLGLIWFIRGVCDEWMDNGKT